MRHSFPLLCVLILFSGVLHADTLTLLDGSTVDGTIIEETSDSIVFKMKFGQTTYKKNELKQIKRSAAAEAPVDVRDLRDVLILNDKTEHRGLIAKENVSDIEFDIVLSGKTVSKLMMTTTKFSRSEIAEIKKLTPDQRAAVRAFIEEVGEQAKTDATLEKDVLITPITWQTDNGNVPASRIEFEYFVIESNTNEEFLRRAAYRLSKVFNAYKEHFGVDRNSSSKVAVVIYGSMKEYYDAIGGKIKNPAFYSRDRKLICTGCDVDALEKAIASIRERLVVGMRYLNSQLAMARTEVQLRYVNSSSIVKAGELKRLDEIEARVKGEVSDLNRMFDNIYLEYTKEMFATLYHEGFHAFVDNFLFPEGEVQYVPRWLNEGLAMYFESSRLEGDRFVLGQENRNFMALLHRFQKDNDLIPIEFLLENDGSDFIVQHKSNAVNSAKNYLESWALVHLLGEKGRLKRENLRAYIDSLMGFHTPVQALQTLSGMSLKELQVAFNEKLTPSFKKAAADAPQK